jgi:hypothetical protein
MTPREIIKDELDEAAFDYRGFHCFIRRHPTSLHLCGYVAVPEGHKAFNHGYDELSIDCHGGLTYCDYQLPGNTQLQGKFWWIGFDCVHWSDWSGAFDSGTYRTFGYVFKNITEIVEQLEKMK